MSVTLAKQYNQPTLCKYHLQSKLGSTKVFQQGLTKCPLLQGRKQRDTHTKTEKKYYNFTTFRDSSIDIVTKYHPLGPTYYLVILFKALGCTLALSSEKILSFLQKNCAIKQYETSVYVRRIMSYRLPNFKTRCINSYIYTILQSSVKVNFAVNKSGDTNS